MSPVSVRHFSLHRRRRHLRRRRTVRPSIRPRPTDKAVAFECVAVALVSFTLSVTTTTTQY